MTEFRQSMTNHPKRRVRAIRHILFHCGRLTEGESLLLICNTETEHIACDIAQVAQHWSHNVDIDVIPNLSMHGAEPPARTAEKMANSSLIICLTLMSLVHTEARRNCAEIGSRFLSLPDFDDEILMSDALMTDYHEQFKVVRGFADRFTAGHKVLVTSREGTKVCAIIKGRKGNCCPGFVDEKGSLGSPPDIEANISPIESSSNGTIVVDGSICCPEIGLLKFPVYLTIVDGLIANWRSQDLEIICSLEKIFGVVSDPAIRYLAEIGVGLNPKAKLTGSMLTDEGALGCVHFGFGANSTVGGKNDVPFHLDFVVREASLDIDGQCLMSNGTLQPLVF